MNGKTITYKILVVILVLLNLYFLFIINTSTNFRNKPILEKPLLEVNRNIKLDSLGIFNNDNLHLYLYIDEEGCSNCILNELRNISKYAKDWNNYITIILKAEGISYMNNFDISLNRILLVSKTPKLFRDINKKNPIAIIVDKNNLIQSINLSESGNPGKSNRFYERTVSLFSTVYK